MFLIGMLSVITGCAIYIVQSSSILGKSLILMGVIIEALAVYKFIFFKTAVSKKE